MRAKRLSQAKKAPCLGGLAALLLIVAATVTVTGAQAAEGPSHSLLLTLSGTTAKTPEPPPWFNYSPNSSFEDACGAAVDSFGDIYISDYYHDAVDVYDSSLRFLTQVAAEDPIDGPCGLAVDNDPTSPSFGDLYVNNWRRNVVKLTPSELPPQAPVTTIPKKPATSYSATVIDPGRATGVATDPATGNVFVDDRSHLSEYSASGALLHTIGEGSLGSAPGSGYGLAVSGFPATAGYVYVADAATATVKAFDPSTSLLTPVEVIDGAGTPQGGFSSLVDSSLAVSPTDGHLYVADRLPEPFEHPAAPIDELNASGAYRGQLPQAIVAGEPTGLAVDGAGNVYVTSGNSERAVLYGFGPTAAAKALEVSMTGAGAGSITSNPAGISCAHACSAEFNEGEALTLTAAPAPGSAFAGWSGGGCSGTSTCHVVLGADTAIGAEFELAPAAPGAVEAAAGPAAGPALDDMPTAGAVATGRPASRPGPKAGRHRHPRHRHNRQRSQGTKGSR